MDYTTPHTQQPGGLQTTWHKMLGYQLTGWLKLLLDSFLSFNF
jgi:hypothetical protein